MLVDFSSFAVLPEESPQHALPPHPEDFGRHASLRRTLPLTGTGVATFSLRSEEITGAGMGVDGGGLDDDPAVLDEFFNVVSRVGIANLCLLCGVQPDFAFADARNGGGEALL